MRLLEFWDGFSDGFKTDYITDRIGLSLKKFKIVFQIILMENIIRLIIIIA